MHIELLFLLFAPLVLLPLLWVMPVQWAKYVSVGVSAGQLLYGLGLLLTSPSGDEAYALDIPWFSLNLQGDPLLTVRFTLGLGGLQWMMLILSGIVLTFAAISALDTIKERERSFHALFLLLCTAIPGCFVAQDAFLFYVFFEVMLIPMYFLVGLWGGQRREFAAIQFFIYTLLGSLLILVGFAICYLVDNPSRLLSLGHLPIPGSALWQTPLGLPFGLGSITLASGVFWVLLIGFLIKLPTVPLHTWLPVAHTEAPTPVSILLAGILLKTGGYGVLYWTVRLFPQEAQQYGSVLSGMGAVSIVYAALLALAAHDLKRLVACSSVSHMGFVLLGIGTGTTLGYQGAAFQLFSHGIISAGLFSAAGSLQHLTGSRDVRASSGLAGPMPLFAGLLAALFFAGMGLPGFSGFIGEFLVIAASLGQFSAGKQELAWPLMALLGLLLTSGYFLWALRRLLMGKLYLSNGDTNSLHDVRGMDAFILWATVGLALIFGLYPHAILCLWDGVI
jgi:NADH-quinone oxidoreductase subunit M